MTRDPVCVDDEASLDEVVALMDARHIAQLPVVCGGSVVGVVSRIELLAAVARALSWISGETSSCRATAAKHLTGDGAFHWRLKKRCS